MEEGSYWLSEAHPVISFDDQMLLRLSLFFRSGAWTVVLFTVYEEHLGNVALTDCARGVSTHPFASYFLVRSSTALRLLSGEHWCFGCPGLS